MSKQTDLLKAAHLLHKNILWDGYGYYMPVVVGIKSGNGSTFTPEPTIEEFTAAIIAKFEPKKIEGGNRP